MSDENPPEYKDGEIVWVKLGSRWWPGEVKDSSNVSSEITGALKKPPLVIVKFFDEDSYEFVRSWTSIYPYNCEKKNDFIKRGMDAFRAKHSHMEKFPKDVSTAEMKTDGNPNILSDPLFAPEKKTSYSALFFGNSPGAKKSARDATPRKKQSQKTKSTKEDMSHITHRRFLGNDDYVAHIRIQNPGRDRNSDDDTVELPQEKKEYTCNICRFITDCLEVIILHSAAHMRTSTGPVGSFTTSKKEKKPSVKKDRTKQPKKSKLSSSQASIDSSDEENKADKNKAKRKRKSQGPVKAPKQRKLAEIKPKTPSDIRSDLLAEWDDGSDNEIEMSQEGKSTDDTDLIVSQKSSDGALDSSNNMDTTQEDDTLNNLTQDGNRTLQVSDDISVGLDKSENDIESQDVASVENIDPVTSDKSEDKPEANKSSDTDPSKTSAGKSTKKSCFDFDEEEEDSVDTFIVASTTGRKIPRVIPPTEKRLSVDLDSVLASSPIAILESDDSQTKTLPGFDDKKMVPSESPVIETDSSCGTNKDMSSEQGISTSDKTNLKSDSQSKDDNLEAAFSELLGSTSVPDLPEIPNTLKFEQNFHCTKTIKFPDKTESPKPVELKSVTSKFSENLTNIATKLTNPKKRFVKSFEDFEIEQKRIASEEKRDSPKEHFDINQSVGIESETESSKTASIEDVSSELHSSDSQKDKDSACSLSSVSDVFHDEKFIDRSENEDNSNMKNFSATVTEITEPSIETCPLKFSKLKTQVMSKLQELHSDKSRDSELSYDVSSKVRRSSTSHRTPRSKILETYRNEHLAEQESIKTSHYAENLKPTALSNSDSQTSLVPSKPPETIPCSLVDADLPGASQYCLKKKKYSKLSRALSREKEDIKIIPEIDRNASQKHSNDLNEKSHLPPGPSPLANTLLCSIPLPEKTDLLAEISKNKIDKTPQNDESLEKKDVTVTLQNKKPETEASVYMEPPQAREEKFEGHKDDILIESNRISGSFLAEHQAATEMEKLFSEDSHSLFSDEARSDVPVTVPPPITKPEFSSTSELMMELADGDKSLSADEDALSLGTVDYNLKFNKEKDTTNKDFFHVTPLKEESSLHDEPKFRNEEKSMLPSENEKSVETEPSNESTKDENASKESATDSIIIDAQELVADTNMLIESESENLSVDKDHHEKGCIDESRDVTDDSQNLSNLQQEILNEIEPPEKNTNEKESEASEHTIVEALEHTIVKSSEHIAVEASEHITVEASEHITVEASEHITVEASEHNTVEASERKIESTLIDASPEVPEATESSFFETEVVKHSEVHESTESSILEAEIIKEAEVHEATESSLLEAEVIKDTEVHETSESSLLEAEVTEDTFVKNDFMKYESDDKPKTSPFKCDIIEKIPCSDTEESLPEVDQEQKSLSNDLPRKINENETDSLDKTANSFQKKQEESDSPKPDPEYGIVEDKTRESKKSEDPEEINTVHFKYTTGKDDDEFDISIKTNLSNFTNTDELSALTTLATVSQLKDDFETGLMLQKNEEKILDQTNEDFNTGQRTKTEACPDVHTEAGEVAADFSRMPKISEEKEISDQNPPHTEVAANACVPDTVNKISETQTVSSEKDCKQESSQKSILESSLTNSDTNFLSENKHKDPVDCIKQETKLLPHPSFPTGHVEVPPKMQEINEADIVPIDGNLTVVSEKDLADCQVEITSSSSKNPVTLTNFSMDYSEVSSDHIYPVSTKESGASILKTKIESKKKKGKAVLASTSSYASSEFVTKPGSSILKPLKHRAKIQQSHPHVEKNSSTVLAAICDLEEHIPPQIVCAKDPGLVLSKEIPKILNTDTTESDGVKHSSSHVKEPKVPFMQAQTKTEEKESVEKTKTPKFVVKSRVKPSTAHNTQPQPVSTKPIILSEKIIKPVTDAESVSVQKITSKRTYQDVEDIDTFIIQKSKRPTIPEETSKPSNQNNIVPAKSGGKAKILQQTIITAAGEIIQPNIHQQDDNVFDINSMPIVLSDDLLTPESIEKMPIVISDSLQAQTIAPEVTQAQVKSSVSVQQQQPQQTVLNKSLAQGTVLQTALTRTSATPKITKTTKVVQNTTGRLIKHTSPSGGKTNKYIILPQSSTIQDSKPTVVKKQTIIKKSPGIGTTVVSQNIVPESAGSKIMIVTNQQGQKQKLLLTPNHQKLLAQGSRMTKTVVKGSVVQKSLLTPRGTHQTLAMAVSTGTPTRPATSSLLLTTNASTSTTVGQPATSPGQLLTPRNIKIDLKTSKKIPMQISKSTSYVPVGKSPAQKTVVLKNQLGQTIRKFQSTDEALLEKQVAEQLQAIKTSSMKSQQKAEVNYKTPKTAIKRSYSKRPSLIETKPTVSAVANQSPSTSTTQATLGQSVPPLAPLASKRQTDHHSSVMQEVKSDIKIKQPELEKSVEQQRPLNQLVIQDAMGNQTTITEGQILALPSETVDGQPQSYMLVTLDESGNLTPLNSEALMSLDPNLNLGGDLSNMVLQIDQGAATANPPEVATPQTALPPPPKQKVAHENIVPEKKMKEKESFLIQPPQVATVKTSLPTTSLKTVEMIPTEQQTSSTEVQPITCSVGGEPGQQLIVTGDPLATQKFLESLSEGTTDLANILANAEGGSILIQADGRQILINTDSNNQNLLLSVNTDNASVNENSESGGNPIFATQPKKNKDILAAALAGTDVFQQEQNSVQNKVVQSQLSPNSSLYPMNVGNVLEPTLTLSSPIMTPLEVPSTNSKKIADDEADILGHVPKNVDLPITITDPNISQTVSQQQVASLIANEIPGNLELPLPITDATISVANPEMSSPTFVYSLPTFEESVDAQPKSFNSSMPLLTEDSEERHSTNNKSDSKNISKTNNKNFDQTHNSSQSTFGMKHDIETDNSRSDKMSTVMHSDGSLMEEGLCTLGGEMCTSLSEPPPDMFELDTVSTENVSDIPEKANEAINNGVSIKSNIEKESVKQNIGGESQDESKPSGARADSTGMEMRILNEDSCEIPILPQIVTTISAEQSVSSSESGKRNTEHEGKGDNT